jgi:hypothetical protein
MNTELLDPPIKTEKYFVTVPIADFSKENNQILKNKRIEKISKNILMVWVNRFIVQADHHINTDWFGVEVKDGHYEFWFKFDSDAKKAVNFFKHIKENGIPSHHVLY